MERPTAGPGRSFLGEDENMNPNCDLGGEPIVIFGNRKGLSLEELLNMNPEALFDSPPKPHQQIY